MMGGSISHEFMLLTPVGEDTIASCHECGFNANMEAADSIIENTRDEVSAPMELVHTPNIHTIEEICDFCILPRKRAARLSYIRETQMTAMLSYSQEAI